MYLDTETRKSNNITNGNENNQHVRATTITRVSHSEAVEQRIHNVVQPHTKLAQNQPASDRAPPPPKFSDTDKDDSIKQEQLAEYHAPLGVS